MKILIAVILFAFVSCAGKSNTANTNRTNEDVLTDNLKGENTMKLDPNCILTDSLPESIKKPILAYALEHRYDENQEDSNHITYTFDYTDDNIKFIFPVVNIWLNKKHYTPPLESIFYSRIKDVFSLDLQASPRQVEKHEKYWVYISDLGRYNDRIYTPNIGYFYFCKEGRFIYNIDISEAFVSANATSPYETCIEERTYHYNNFIFNNSNASLTWLLNNDMFFIEQLVIDFGYDKN